MNSSLKYLTYYLAVSIIFSCTKEQETPEKTKTITKKSSQIFEKLSSEKSNVIFNNKITANLTNKFNLFDFDYFYNGAGVAVGDINNDGLQDILFTGNQTNNKLFLNKGNLSFEDISTTAGINKNKFWSNGATFVDINNDGWLDIYISQGGPHERKNRKNLLFINNKNNTFEEKATEYGLADSGISTQAAFFDYDKDGDLDCIVSNEADYYGFDPKTFSVINKKLENLKLNSSKFYENINGKYIDITQKAGLLSPTFGLGLCVADINNDNWLDIYIANDYYVPDAMYINNKNGTFTNAINKNTNQVSFFGMGVDIADINNDNLDDIFVLDMASQDHVKSKTLMASMDTKGFNLLKNLGYQTQYMFNSLQLNMGNDSFFNISHFLKMAKTDWSWAGLIFDVDNDEKEDIYVTNGYRKYALDNDFRRLILKTKKQYNNDVPISIKQEIYNKLPTEKISNILFKSTGNLEFTNHTPYSGLFDQTYSNGGIYADLDNDGDLEIITNNIDDNASIFKNLTSEKKQNNYITIIPKGVLSENFARIKISYQGKHRVKEAKKVRGYLSSASGNVNFGVGNANIIDTLQVFWNSGKFQELYNIKANSFLTVKEKDAKINRPYSVRKSQYLFEETNDLNFTHKENVYNDFNKEILLPYKQSTLGPHITVADINNDNIDDVFIGGAHKQPGALFISKNNTYSTVSNKSLFTKDANFEDMESIFVDIDNDGDKDLYVVSGGNEFNSKSDLLKDRLYLNDGKGNFKKSNFVDIHKLNGKTITKIDIDNDGDKDLIIGNRIAPQKYPIAEPSIIYENNNGQLINVTDKICKDLNEFGIINKVITTDFNNDGWEDFIAVGEWSHIGLFKNEKGTFKDISINSNLNNELGWWLTITETDINNDGYKDYIVGNVGKNIKLKANQGKPLRIYAHDFDSNGTHDIVLSYKYNNSFVPLRGKECSTQQMPFIAKKIPTFHEFANSTIEDIYGDKIDSAYKKEANQFNSLLLLNNKDETFEKIELPKLAQTIPILTAESFDYNNDGYQDILVAGNIYNTEVETPKLDNNFALILESNKVDNYKVLKPNETGLYTNGNVKSSKIIKNKNGFTILFGLNDGKTKTFKLNKK